MSIQDQEIARLSTIAGKLETMPPAPSSSRWVVMYDDFMSSHNAVHANFSKQPDRELSFDDPVLLSTPCGGWNMGRAKSYMVVHCQNDVQATAITLAANERGEMSDIRTLCQKPWPKANEDALYSYKDITTLSGRWMDFLTSNGEDIDPKYPYREIRYYAYPITPQYSRADPILVVGGI